MFKGGVTIRERTSQIIRFTSLAIPIILASYGLLIDGSFVDSSHYTGTTTLICIVVPWIVMAAVKLLYPTKALWSTAVWLVAYHLFAALYILFIAGFAMPFTAAWVLLIIGSYTYFALPGMWASVGLLATITITDILIHADNQALLLTDAFTALVILIIGLAVIAITRIQEIDSLELSRTKALESLQHDRILTIVNNLADAVLSTDDNGIVKVYNAASLSLLDTNTGLNGQYINDILSLYDETKNHINIFNELKQSQGVVVRNDLITTIGNETTRLSATYSPIRSTYTHTTGTEKHDGYILILRDITKAKSLEEERDEFISVVSHELRTPITIAEGTISNVQVMMGRTDIPKKALEQSLTMAHNQVIFLAKMVNDLGTLSRVERGANDIPESIDVQRLISDLYKEYQPQAKAKKLHLNLDLGTKLGTITKSRLYIEELLQNFITNAIKYTKEGSITLRVTRKKKTITFEVIDTGIGISKSDQRRVFEKFYRSEDYRTRETGGTGLGLYVASKLAKKLGTYIELESRLNHGSTFSFTFTLDDQ